MEMAALRLDPMGWIHPELARWWRAELARDSERPPWRRWRSSSAGGEPARHESTTVLSAQSVRAETIHRRHDTRRHGSHAMSMLSKETQADRVETIVEFEKRQVERANS